MSVEHPKRRTRRTILTVVAGVAYLIVLTAVLYFLPASAGSPAHGVHGHLDKAFEGAVICGAGTAVGWRYFVRYVLRPRGF